MKLTIISLVSKGTTTVAHLVATYLILRYLSLDQQGYYYAFAALIAVQSIFELGLSQLVVVFLSHESTLLVSEDLKKYAKRGRSGAIASATLIQYLKITLLFICSVGIVGIFFFQYSSDYGPHNSDVDWFLPWVLLVVFSSLKLPIVWLEAVIEGLGHLQQVLVVRIVNQFAWFLAFLAALELGFGLAAPAIAIFVYVVTALFGYIPYRHVIRQLTYNFRTQARCIDWKTEVQPLQRKLSATWVASYMISYSPIPISLIVLGAEEAGRIGIAFQIAASIGVITGAIIGPKVSIASRLIAAKCIKEYKDLFRHTFALTIIVGSIIGFAGVIAVFVISYINPEFGPRLPDLLTLTPLLISAVINCAMSCVSTFVRAQKIELFALPLSFVAFIIVIGMFAIQGLGGSAGITSLHLVGAVCITLPFTLFVFYQTMVEKYSISSSL